MESIVINVRDIEAGDRQALEHVVGQGLCDSQRLIIQIAEVDISRDALSANSHRPQTLADWTNVYRGLSDEQIDATDKIIKTRANLTRNPP
jgi:hypothetical protein